MLDESICVEEGLITCLVSKVNEKTTIDSDESEGVWVIFATRKKDNARLAYEVGHSDDVCSELNLNIKKMFQKEKKKQIGFFTDELAYEWLDKRDCKYQTLINDYEDIAIYKINVPVFLEYESLNGYLHKIDGISIVRKIVLAEILFAFESKAICWNPGPKSKDDDSYLAESERIIAQKLKRMHDTVPYH